MRRWLPLVALIAIVGCGKKKAPEPTATATDPAGGGFVEISIGEEEEEGLEGSELMAATAKCGDLVSLEPAAMMGKLKDTEIRCLDDAIRGAEKQTVKDKISRVLMSDAWAKGDQHRWEGIVRKHLNEIDRSDPDLCYKFAKYLSEKGPEHAEETMHWADVALENRTQWTGDTFVSRVYALYKLRALASSKNWQALESKYVAGPSDELLKQKDRARADAKTLAREWLEYAKQSGKDPTMAMQLCVSAAGNEDFCSGV